MAKVRKHHPKRRYSTKPKAIRARIRRNKGSAGAGKDHGHKVSLKNNGSSDNTDTRPQSRSANRAAGGKSGNKRGKAAGGRKGSSAAKRRAGRLGGRKSRGRRKK